MTTTCAAGDTSVRAGGVCGSLDGGGRTGSGTTGAADAFGSAATTPGTGSSGGVGAGATVSAGDASGPGLGGGPPDVSAVPTDGVVTGVSADGPVGLAAAAPVMASGSGASDTPVSDCGGDQWGRSSQPEVRLGPDVNRAEVALR